MTHNLYWSVYQNLEKELIELSNHIHIDDKQLKVYSMKIAELLIRTCVEFESLAKELYLNNGGTKSDDKELYFDTDCLAFLKEKWKLDLKKVQVVSSNFYFNEDKNKVLMPLRKAHKRGDSSAKWLQAYQAVKHNRRTSLEKANLENLLNSMAALFILNLYYRNNVFDLGNDGEGKSFDYTCGSNIFSTLVPKRKTISVGEKKVDSLNEFDEYIYIVSPIPDYESKMEELLQKLFDTINSDLSSGNVDAKVLDEKYFARKAIELEIHKLLEQAKYQAILNKISIRN